MFPAYMLRREPGAVLVESTWDYECNEEDGCQKPDIRYYKVVTGVNIDFEAQEAAVLVSYGVDIEAGNSLYTTDHTEHKLTDDEYQKLMDLLEGFVD